MIFSTCKKFCVVAIVVVGTIFSLPTLFPWTTSWSSYLSSVRVNFGLDLRGGSSIVFEVDNDDVMSSAYRSIAEQLRRILNAAKIGYMGLRSNTDGVSITIRKDEQKAAFINSLKNLDMDVGFVENGNIFSVKLKDKAKSVLKRNALVQSIEVINKRVNECRIKKQSR